MLVELALFLVVDGEHGTVDKTGAHFCHLTTIRLEKHLLDDFEVGEFT